MPRTIKTTGDYAVDREIDALWNAIGRDGQDFERTVQPIIQQVVVNSPEFITVLEEKIEHYITNIMGVKSIRTEFGVAVGGDIRLIEGTAMGIHQADKDFTFNVATCDEAGQPIGEEIPPTVAFYDQFTEVDATNLPIHTPDVGTGWRSTASGYNPHSAYTDGYCRAFSLGLPWQDWAIDRLQHAKELNIIASMGWTTTPAKILHLVWGTYPGSDPTLIPSDVLVVRAQYNSGDGTVTLSTPSSPEGKEAESSFAYTIGTMFEVRIRLRRKNIEFYRNGIRFASIDLDDILLLDGCVGIRTTGSGIALDAAYDTITVTGPYDPMAGESDIPAKCDHRHVGVHGVKTPGGTLIHGDVTMSAGDGLDVAQSGGTITYAGQWRRHFILG